MNQSQVHSQGNIPFSWENKPGSSKASKKKDSAEDDLPYLQKKLPPPPCPSNSPPILIHEIQLPLPPCPFPPPSRSNSRKGLKKLDDRDPFLAAFKECTKASRKCMLGSGLKKGMFGFSCKRSCNVVDDSLVRFSPTPHESETKRT